MGFLSSLLDSLIGAIAPLLENLLKNNPELTKALVGMLLWIDQNVPWLAKLLESLMNLLG